MEWNAAHGLAVAENRPVVEQPLRHSTRRTRLRIPREPLCSPFSMLPRILCVALFAAVIASTPVPAPAGVVLWYPFNEGSGAVVSDSSGNGNHLSANAGGFLWNQKSGAPFGGSIHFNGTGSALAQKNSVTVQGQTIDSLRARSGNKATITFWANPDTQGQGTSPFGFLKAGPGRVLQTHLLWTDSNVYWDVGSAGASGDAFYRASAATTSAPSVWTYWAFVYDGALTTQTLKVYRDSALVASASVANPLAVNWAGIDIAELGTSQIYGSRWVGSMDDFALWDEALSASQIATVRASGVQALVPPRINSFIATPGNIAPGGTAALSWNTSAATSLSINNGVGTVTGATGSVNVSPASSTTYRLTAANAGGSIFKDVLLAVGATVQPLVLNEFLADNGSGLLDEDGTKQDWIEIYNPNAFAVSANGWKLVSGVTTWTFPNVQIEGGAYLVVFASAKNRVNPAATLHTNFKLSQSGEYLALKKPDNTIATEFAPAYPAQHTDASCALSGGTPVFFVTPTPGAANGASVAGFVADTVFSVNRGFYSATQNVAITCATIGAQIRYTTDNSTPTVTTGTVYSAPVAVSATTVLRVRAFLAGLAPSNTDTQSYIFVADVPNQGASPAGWPANGSAQLNGQVMRYGFNATLKAQYTAQQLTDALNQIPSFSIVTDQSNLTDQATGIYNNALLKGDAWERAASFELLNPSGSDGFHINCGLRIRGGYSRNDAYPKHSFRLYFRSQYGEGKLKHPLFGNAGTDEFQTIDIRSEQNYSWATDGGTENTAVREVFCRDLFATMGQSATRSRYYHLYLNGQYWGLFMTEERAQEDYAATYLGGAPDDYDVIQTSNHSLFTYEVASGTVDAWQTTWNLGRACAANPTNANYFALLGRDANGVRVPAMPVYVDPDHLATYMMLHYYTGDGDGPLSNFLGMNQANNWRGFRNRLTDAGWRFFPHDCEHTLLAPSWVAARATNNTTTGANRSNFTYSNSEWLHEDLATNPEYKLKIADVAQRYLFNNGALTAAKAQAVFDLRPVQIGNAIVADCTRWGTSATNHTLAQWNTRLANIRANYFPTRTATVIGHLQTRGFYPTATPPVFSQHGGQVAPGYALTLTNGGQTGTMYFTLDGSDPRAVGGAAVGTAYASAITINAPVLVRARFLSSGGVWSAIDDVPFTIYPPAVAGKLVVSKLHYHPPGPTTAETTAGFTSSDAFEYIELLNISATETLDLRGVTITDGVTFSFATAAITTLAPGARVLVVANSAAMAMRHGGGLPIAGVFAGSFHNSGEPVRITDANSAVIVQFTYDDLAPWPTAADGSGSALVLINPTANPDPAVAANWRASYVPGGVPGAADVWTIALWRSQYFSAADLGDPALEATLWGDAADPDSDGFTNFAEFVLNASPLNPQSRPAMTVSTFTDIPTQQQYLRLACPVREGLSGVTINAQGSGDLTAWASGPALVSSVSQGNGTMLMTWQDNVSVAASPGSRRFLRLQILSGP